MAFEYERWKEAQFSRMEREKSARKPFPASIAWAGIIWAATGVFTLGTVLVLSAQTGTIRSPGAILGGLLFLYGGLRATSGTTPGTLLSGIASLALGIVWVAAGVFSAELLPGANGIPLLIVSGGMGGALILAGLLALTGRSSYQKWRDARARGGRLSHGK